MGSSSQQRRGSEGHVSSESSEHRILAPSRRPDGTLRKPVRIRAGYVPQDEVAIYHPRPLRREMASRCHSAPPGSDPHQPDDNDNNKPKTKAVKRNQRKKEKRLQAALEKEKNSEPNVAQNCGKHEAVTSSELESVHSLTSQMNEQLDLSADSSTVAVSAGSVEQCSEPIGAGQDIDKRIRALKKKIRQTEALQQKTAEQDMKPEQLEKLAKLEGLRKELKLLEDKKAETPAA